MKNIRLGILSFFAAIQAAHAQSSVTLYGSVDAGITYVSNIGVPGAAGNLGSHSSVELSSGNNSPNRWGLRGTEDLGGGNKAVFALENSFFLTNGTNLQTNAEFNRLAYVGVANDKWGTLTFGRQYDAYSDALGGFVSSNIWATPQGSHFGDIDNLNQALNFNNAIKYSSPVLAGFSFGGIFSFGNTPGNFASGRGWALGVNYANGPTTLGAGYMTLRNPFQAALGGGADGSDGGYIGDLSGTFNSNAPYDQLQNAARLDTFGAGGSYAFGDLVTAAVITHSRLSKSQYFARAGGTVSDANFNTGELSAMYNLTPALMFGAAYAYTWGHASETGAQPRFHQVNLGTVYSVSKRTALYAIGIFQRASGDGIGAYVNPRTGAMTTGLALAQIAVQPSAGNRNQLSLTVGLRHNF